VHLCVKLVGDLTEVWILDGSLALNYFCFGLAERENINLNQVFLAYLFNEENLKRLLTNFIENI